MRLIRYDDIYIRMCLRRWRRRPAVVAEFDYSDISAGAVITGITWTVHLS